MKRLILLFLLCAASVSAQTVRADRFTLATGPCTIRSGSGTPEGVVTGVVCDIYFQIDSPYGIYRKTSGTGNTGWDGTIYAGTYARLTSNGLAGYFQDSTNGAYRAIVGTGTLNGFYFQTNAGNSTSMYVGLGGAYLGRVGIGTSAPGAPLEINGASPYLTLNSTNGSAADSEIQIQRSGVSKWAFGTRVGDATENFNLYNYTTADINVGVEQSTGRVSILHNLDVSGYVGVPSYVSQTTGWRITAAGKLDVRYLFSDEMRVKLFTADLESVLAGSQRVTKSFSTISQAFTCPVSNQGADLWVFDSPTFGNAAVFVPGDQVIIHSMNRTEFGPFSISDCVGSVDTYTDGTGANAGQQYWIFHRNTGVPGNGGTMTATTVVAVNQLVQDMGVTGNGYVETSAVDGASGINAPYTQVVTWATAPVAANLTVRARLGNLKGITATTEYGLIAGTYAATNGHYFRASDQAFELHGIDLSLWQGATKTMFLDHATPSFALGATVPSAYGTGTGIWMGNDGGTYKFRVGVPGVAGVFWDGSTLSVNGALYASVGAIGGFTLGADYILDAGNSFGLASTVTGGDDVRFWAGATFANRATAPFRVTEAGVVTATSGAIGGWTLGATTFSGTSTVLDANGALTLGTGNDVVVASAVDATYRLWIGNFATPASAPFRVTKAGALTATNATITGAITATSGAIGGCSLSSTTLTCGNTALTSGGITITSGSGSTNKLNFSDGSWVGASASGQLILSGSTRVDLTDQAAGKSVRFDSSMLYPSGSVSLGNGSNFWTDLYLNGNIHLSGPATTTNNDYPMVYSTGNTQLYQKTDGYDGTCSNPTSIIIERGIVVGCS